MTSIEDTTASLSEVDFPSVTICNVNQVLSDFICQSNVPNFRPDGNTNDFLLWSKYCRFKSFPWLWHLPSLFLSLLTLWKKFQVQLSTLEKAGLVSNSDTSKDVKFLINYYLSGKVCILCPWVVFKRLSLSSRKFAESYNHLVFDSINNHYTDCLQFNIRT